MRVHHIALSLALALGCGIAVQGAASAQENRGTVEQQMACTPDVWRLCFDQIPDVGRITACLRQNTPQLSGACRAVFESNDSVSEQTAQTAPQARRRQVQPRVHQVQPEPQDDDDQ